MKRSRTTITAGDGDPRHGTQNSYSYHLCRCDLCREAAAQYQREHRAGRSFKAQLTRELLAERNNKPSGRCQFCGALAKGGNVCYAHSDLADSPLAEVAR